MKYSIQLYQKYGIITNLKCINHLEKVPYSPPNPYLFRDAKRSKMLKDIKKNINKLNISPMELGLNICNLE